MVILTAAYQPSFATLLLTTNIEVITECKQAQQALQNNEVRFHALIENANDLILIIDAEG
ncbi:MAG: hypothetical protein F6K08_17930, partial [Okeania sp. SIO1H6]|nr:hypothetical protein [Okeania sp. SIO1H6]